MELAFVLVIIAVMAGSALMVANTRSEPARIINTNNKMERIEQALASFLVLNRYLPCPARGDYTESDAGFGVSDCTIATTATGGGAFLVGSIPVRTLNIPDAYLYDGWDKRITYAIDTNFTTSSDFRSTDAGTLTINDYTGANRTTEAVLVLLSHGTNGHGAWLKSGGLTRYAASGVISANETENAEDPADYLSFDSTFVQSARVSDFDDIIHYMLKWQIIRRAGGVIYNNQEICDDAARILKPVRVDVDPDDGPLGCFIEETPAACSKTVQASLCNQESNCVVRELQLAEAINARCVRQ